MRLPRFRLRIRTLLWVALAALVVLGLIGQKVYHDGPEIHWLALKLRFGNVEARRSAAAEVWALEMKSRLRYLVDPPNSAGPPTPEFLQERWNRRRRTELLFPVLLRATNDNDPGCRANALKALDVVTCFSGSDHEQDLTFRQALKAARDPVNSVRKAAMNALSGLAKRDKEAVIATIQSALADPSIEVRQAAAWELGQLGLLIPESQPRIAAILIPLLAGREDPRVRAKAAWGMCLFGQDSQRHSTCPDLFPALLAALNDPEVEVRRALVDILGTTSSDSSGQKVLRWDKRKDAILSALKAAIDDTDKTIRENAALALFDIGMREPVLIELIKQAGRDPARVQKSRFVSALEEGEKERESKNPVEPDARSKVTQ